MSTYSLDQLVPPVGLNSSSGRIVYTVPIGRKVLVKEILLHGDSGGDTINVYLGPRRTFLTTVGANATVVQPLNTVLTSGQTIKAWGASTNVVLTISGVSISL